MGAGEGSGFSNDEYRKAGAEISSRETVYGQAELIVKVTEPLRQEYNLLHEGVALFTYLHLAPNPELTKALLGRHVTGLAYETIVKEGRLPLLAPMSEVAGRMAPIMAALYL